VQRQIRGSWRNSNITILASLLGADHCGQAIRWSFLPLAPNDHRPPSGNLSGCRRSEFVFAPKLTVAAKSILLTAPPPATPSIRSNTVSPVVTSPPFLDVVQYAGDNWLRCWFAGIDSKTGTNDNLGSGPAVDLMAHPFPMQVPLDKFGNGFSNVVMVSNRDYHSIALNADGSVWMWGANDQGQCGDGTTHDLYRPSRGVGLGARTLLPLNLGKNVQPGFAAYSDADRTGFRRESGQCSGGNRTVLGAPSEWCPSCFGMVSDWVRNGVRIWSDWGPKCAGINRFKEWSDAGEGITCCRW
jgi:Regulator of chromosome condensation (RCC1) repeat